VDEDGNLRVGNGCHVRPYYNHVISPHRNEGDAVPQHGRREAQCRQQIETLPAVNAIQLSFYALYSIQQSSHMEDNTQEEFCTYKPFIRCR